MRGKAARRRAERAGRRAELLAILFLGLKFYRPVAWRRRTPVGEIDLVVRRGRVLAVVEVKRRADLADAAHSIGPRQRARVARAADWLVGARRDLARLDRRYDVVLVAPGRWPLHLKDAWR